MWFESLSLRRMIFGSDFSTEALAYTERSHSRSYDDDGDVLLPRGGGVFDGPAVAFVHDSLQYSIDVTDRITAATEIPVHIHMLDPGAYTLSAALNVYDLPVYLLDHRTGHYIDLATDVLTIQSSGHEDLDQYSVVFSKDGTQGTNAVSAYGKTNAIVIDRADDAGIAEVKVYNVIGQQIISTSMTTSTLELPIEQGEAIYLVSVRQNGSETVRKVFVK